MITSHCLACNVGMTAANADSTNLGLKPIWAAKRLAQVDFASDQRAGFVVIDAGRRAVVGGADLERARLKHRRGRHLGRPGGRPGAACSPDDEQPDMASTSEHAPAMTPAMAVFFTVPPRIGSDELL